MFGENSVEIGSGSYPLKYLVKDMFKNNFIGFRGPQIHFHKHLKVDFCTIIIPVYYN